MSAGPAERAGRPADGVATRRITYPHMGEYRIAFRALAETLGAEVVEAPKMTRATLEAGARHSPEFVCVPFKYNMGNFLEALERGANVVVQAGGGCRFGYYGEVQEQILRDLGWEHEFVHLTYGWSLGSILRQLRRIQPSASYPRVVYAFAVAFRKAQAIEAVEDFVRKNVGFETERGAMDRVVARFLRELGAAKGIRATARVRSATLAELTAVPIDKPVDPLRVGVVGELYALMEPFANCGIERKIAEHGVEVHRFITLTGLIVHGIGHRKHLRHMLERTGGYVEHHLGADGTESVAKTLELMDAGFDGMVHLKPFGCMPEVSAMSALQRISREHTFPILFVSYDAQTAETGIVTRVEAFCDMLEMRKRGRVSA